MDSIAELKKMIEKEITKTNTKISTSNIASSLDSIVPLFSEEGIWQLNSSTLEMVLKYISKTNQLSTEEISFLTSFINMPEEMKNFKKKQWGLGEKQKQILLQIQKKIVDAKNTLSKESIEQLENLLKQYKILQSKLEQNDMNLITEVDFVSTILNANQVPFDKQLKIFQEINQINEEIFHNYSLSFTDVSEEMMLSEDDLIETNMKEEELDTIFKKFDITWEYSKDKLLKYGNSQKIEQMLIFLKNNNLTFIFQLPEILVKTLLFTTIEQLEELIEVSIKNQVDFHVLLKKQPTIFFPTIKEKRINLEKRKNNNKKNTVFSGSLNNYLNNIKFLKEHDLSIEEVFKECPSFFVKNSNTVALVYSRLESYGIRFKYPDGTLRKGFSVLGTLDVLDKLDIGIECDSYEYYQENISRLIDPSLNLYRVKLAKNRGVSKEEIFKEHTSINGHIGICLPSIFWDKQAETFGVLPVDTFQKYHAIKVTVPYQDFYDGVINNSENDTISDIALQDYLIEQVEELYRVPNNPLIYNFNGVIISRLKVLRYYQTLISNPEITSSKDILMYAITKFSMLNQEEYDAICQCMKQIKIEGRELV